MKKPLAQSLLRGDSDDFSDLEATSLNPHSASQPPANQNLEKVIYLGVAFMILHIAFNGVQNVLNMVLTNLKLDKLGNLALLSVNISFGLSSIVAPKFVNILEYRFTFALVSSPYVFFMLVGRFIASCEGAQSFSCSTGLLSTEMVIASLMLGTGASVLWLAQSAYITECASAVTRGRYFGVFWSLMQSSQIAGNFSGGLIWQYYGPLGLFTCMLVLSSIAVGTMLGVKRPEKVVEDVKNTKIIEFQKMNPSENASDEEDSDNQAAGMNAKPVELSYWHRTILVCSQPKFKSFIPLFLVSSYCLGMFVTYLATLTKEAVIESSEDQIGSRVGYVLLTLGIFEVLAGQIFGYFIDRDIVNSVKLLYLVNFAALIFSFLAFVSNSYTLYFACAALYGLADAGSQTVVGTLLSLKFKEKVEPFAGFRAYWGCSLALFYFMFMWLPGAGLIVALLVYAGLLFNGWANLPTMVSHH